MFARCHWSKAASSFGTAFPSLKKLKKTHTHKRQKVAFVCVPVHWTQILCRERGHLSANETETSKRKQNTFHVSLPGKKKERLVVYKVKIFIQSSWVVTTVTKPKLHLAAERKYRNGLWLIQLWLCWVFRAVPILARLQFKLWCCMDWLQVTPVIQHAFWKVWLTFPLLETKIRCKNLLVLHTLWNTALENVSCEILVISCCGAGLTHWQQCYGYMLICKCPYKNNTMKNWVWWIYVLSWL